MFTEDRHKSEYGESPQVISMVPGVTTFAGEFSMYCQGYSLCATNDRSLSVEVSTRSDSTVRIFNSYSNDRKKFGLAGIKYRKEDRWANYVKGMVLEMQRHMGIPGLNITLSGNLLCCDGRVLSAAIGVGVGMALYRLLGLEPDVSVVASCCFNSCFRFCSELYNRHFILTMLHAKEGSFLLFDMHDGLFRHVDSPFGNADFSIALANGNIPPLAMREELYFKHNLVKSAMESLSILHASVSLRRFPVEDLLDRQLPVDEETRTICCYVFEESNTALLLERLFAQKDFIQIGKALSKLGKGLRDKIELTCPELDWLSKRSIETPGCYGSSIVYNGAGGYVAMVMEDASFDAYLSKLDDYERIFGFKAWAFRYAPGGGASTVSV